MQIGSALCIGISPRECLRGMVNLTSRIFGGEERPERTTKMLASKQVPSQRRTTSDLF